MHIAAFHLIFCPATKICEISTVDLSYVVMVKSTVEISQNFVAFSEYMNFRKQKYLYNAYDYVP